MKQLYIQQKAGLGDIFFLQKVAFFFARSGIEVIWPIKKEFLHISDYIYSSARFIDETEYPFKHQVENACCGLQEISSDVSVLTADKSRQATGSKYCMLSKYEIAGISFKDWSTYFNFQRNDQKEDELFYDVLGLKDDSEYYFINENIGSPGFEQAFSVPYPKDKQVISLSKIEGFSVFDWCKVFANAAEIHIMETCISYLMEKIPLKASKYSMYHRAPSWTPFCEEITMIHRKPTEYHGSEDAKWVN